MECGILELWNVPGIYLTEVYHESYTERNH